MVSLEFEIRGFGAAERDFKFIDALGREILSQTISSSTINSINTGSLASGIYIMIIDNGNGEINKTKVTIQQ